MQIENQPGTDGATGEIGNDLDDRPVSHRMAVRRMRIAVLSLLAVPLACGAPEPQRAPPPHLILVTVDTLRADRLAAWGSPRPVAPRLDEWIRRAVVFEQMRTPSPWTLPAIASIRP